MGVLTERYRNGVHSSHDYRLPRRDSPTYGGLRPADQPALGKKFLFYIDEDYGHAVQVLVFDTLICRRESSREMQASVKTGQALSEPSLISSTVRSWRSKASSK